MGWMRGLWERVREMLQRERFEDELDEEIAFHLEREAERLMAAGLDPDFARAEARRRFGDVSRVREDARDVSGVPWLECALRDARLAVRVLRRSPGFAASAILTLGLGIGATSAIFSVVDSVLLEPLPYPDPDRLVRIVQQNSPENRWNISVADFLALEERQEVFESVAAYQVAGAALSGAGPPEQITVGRVTADWFRVLGVEPAEGRTFLEGEDRGGASPVVVLGSALRDRLLGPGADALGTRVLLDGVPHTVVGVLEPGRATLAGVAAEAWPVLRLETPPRRGPFTLRGLARLRVDRTLEDARTELDEISRAIFPLWVDTGFRDEQARMTPYRLEALVLGDVRADLWLIFGAVAGVLLIAVSNVGNLFLVRAAAREREMALRASLGATRVRLAAQLVVESLVVAGAGGLAGLLLAWTGLEALLRADLAIPRVEEIGLDGSVLVVVGAITLGSAVLFGLAPLVRSFSAGTGRTALRTDSLARDAQGWSRLRAGLVSAEFAVAFILTTGAGLLVASFVRLQSVDPGYDAADAVAVQLSLPAARYPAYEDVQLFWQDALRGISETPGVEASGLGAALPPAGSGSAGTNNFDLLDRPIGDGESEPASLWNLASPGFFAALRVPLLRGRIFDERDREGGEPVVVVSESWARRYYPDREVLGARLYAGGDRSVAMTVVGIVGDVKYLGLDGIDDAAVYEPHWQGPLRTAHVVVRGRDADALVERTRRQIGTLDPELPLTNIETMLERTADSLSRPRQWTILLSLFAGAGLLLACVGVYGVLSYYVRIQRKEIGIRVSLGAAPSTVRRLVIGRGMTLAAIGVAVGVGASIYVARWLRALVFGVSPTDPLALALVGAGLMAVAFVACALPAITASRIDPALTLKGD